VAQTLSAKKRIRQNEKSRARNRWRKEQIREVTKSFEEAVHSGDKAQMASALQVCYKKLDKVAGKGTIHKNTAARTKSRLAKAMNKAIA